jgi:hypothetical protein
MSGWRLRDGAGRYEVGNYNYIGLAALQAVIGAVATDPAAVEQCSVTAAVDLRAALLSLYPHAGCAAEPPVAHPGHWRAAGGGA